MIYPPVLLPCPRCGRAPLLHTDGAYAAVHCGDCFDGAPDSRSLCATSHRGAYAAAGIWNTAVMGVR